MMSLRKADYNHPSPVSWRTFEGIRQPWKDAGLLEENTGFPGVLAFGNPGPMVGRLSRFRATQEMLGICEGHGITVENADAHFAVEFDMPSELVKITKLPFETPNTPRVKRLRDEVAALNAFFAKHNPRTPKMPQITPAFAPDLVTTMRRALDVASDRVPVASRTPATKAKMAQRIVRSAHEGIRDAQQPVAAAVAEGMEPAL